MKRKVRLWLVGMLLGGVSLAPAAGPHGIALGEQEATPPVSWIAIGGGAEPASNQVSLEQDLALATQVFSGRGILLFAGGPNTLGVQVLRDGHAADPLLLELGDLFDPRDGRQAAYRPTKLRPDAAATPETALAAIESALAEDGKPLLLYVAAHGERGDLDRENHILLWGGYALSARDLARVLDAETVQRPVRLVVTACFSGGFAELAFADADAENGAPRHERCGLFATTADEMSSGCDPNPNRREQEGYGLHFLHALRGENRSGRRLERQEIDFDRDDRISLLEAHTRARLATNSFDVPTSTSERWLRAVAPHDGPQADVDLPEEDTVIEKLGHRLSQPDAAAAQVAAAALGDALRGTEQDLESAGQHLDGAAADLQTALLERWPVLDDPWHPDFRNTLRTQREVIASYLASAPLAEAYRRARASFDEHARRTDELKLRHALLRRLNRAHETRALARRLAARGGPSWQQYLRLLACERSEP